jgi:hypothetical protein
MIQPGTTYRLRLSSETHRLLTKKLTAKRVASLLASARADFAAFTATQFGITTPGYMLTLCDVDGFNLYSTDNGTDWQRHAGQPLLTMFRQ